MGLFDARFRTSQGGSRGAGGEERPGERLHVAFGAERIGFIGIRAPWVSVIVVALAVVLAVFGMRRLVVDDSLSELFRSDTPEFRQFEQETREFPSNEFDVLVVIEGKTLLSRESIEAMRRLAVDLQLVDGDRGIVSIFSARQPAADGGIPAPVFPEDLPEGPAYDALIDKLKSNDLIRGKLLSEDGALTLMVMSLDPKVTQSADLGKTIADIRQTIAEDLQGLPLTTDLSGVPVIQLQIRQAVERDRITYNAAGFLLGCLIAILFFRRPSFLFIAAGPPLLAIVLALGAVGWLGLRLNMFLPVMTPLIMVISFSDSMQLTFAARDRIIKGDDRPTAFRSAILTVGPACVLTHVTAALSFLALRFSSSDLIRAFGEAGVIAMGIALVTVLALLPALGVLIAPTSDKLRGLATTDTGVNALRAFAAWVADRMTRRPGLITIVAILVVVGMGSAYLGLEPRYRLADQVPQNEHAVEGIDRIDTKLAGANPVDVLIQFPPGESLFSPDTLDTIAEVHSLVEKQAGVGNVWSLETLRRWLAQKLGKTDVGTLQEYVGYLPRFLVQRFVAADAKSVVVAGRIPDKDSSELLPVVDKLDHDLGAVRAQHPGYTISVTGLAVISARNSAGMIEKLGRGLTVEFGVVAIFIGLAFRSVSVTLVTILTGIFPVVAAAFLLWLLGDGLQFASVIALTVSFGLGLSATIHFLNRLWREIGAAPDPAVGVRLATVLVGPALILTSVVLMCGLAATSLSNLPMLRMFGWLSAFTMFAALVADLTILRPAITLLMRWERRYTPGGTAP